VRAPRIKICGVTRVEDAEHAVESGAWAVGMILWPGSSRVCTLPDAEAIARSLRRRAETCGVFVNASLDEVVGTVEGIGLTMVQLHGDEGPSFCSEVARRTGVKVVKAARVRDGGDVRAIESFRTDFHLLDAHVEGSYGGTGTTFDHALVDTRRSSVPLLLSGGLTPENVVAAIGAVAPWGVDVASGVESAPGVKDPTKVEAFTAAVRSTGDEPHEAPAPESHDVVAPEAHDLPAPEEAPTP
jgi:phosphoribosylanthranilate isomerase